MSPEDLQPAGLTEEGSVRLMQHALDMWIDPEVQRRRALGALPENFVLSSAQVIWSLDEKAPEVRLNHEIRVVAKVRVNRAIKAGEYVMENDVEGLESLEVTDHDANAAHFTMVFVRDRWHIAFDFRYNAARVAEAVATSREFLDAATDALGRGHMRSCVDTLFSAVELLAKSTLLLLSEPRIFEGKRHGAISARYNRWGHVGHVDRRFVDLLNRLSELRIPARYPPASFTLSAERGAELLALAEAMYAATKATVPPRTEVLPEFLPPWHRS